MRTKKNCWLKALDRIKHYRLKRSFQRDRRVRERQIKRALRQARKWHQRHRNSRRSRKQREENLLSQLSSLRQQVADVEYERDAARQQIQALETSLAQLSSGEQIAQPEVKARQPVLRFASAAGFVVLFGALASATSSLNEPSDTQENLQSVTPASTAAHTGAFETVSVAKTTEEVAARETRKRLRSQSLKENIRRLGYNYRKRTVHQQWGPPVYMADMQATKPAAPAGFDPLVREQQENLLALGFDLGQASADGLMGARTQQALDEFQALYLSAGNPEKTPGGADLAFITGVYADLARDDAKKFNIDRGVLAAIRLSSVRTGVEFSYLMELAAVESNFDPVAKASTSSAVGLYQFTHDTWLETLKAHGEKYGLGDYASQVEYIVYRSGNKRPRIRDVEVYQHVLDLRKNPRVSAMMAAESVKDNLKKLTFVSDSEPGRTDLYLTHFFGTDDAISFLKALDETPGSFAVDIFPEAAESNYNVFHPKTCKPRTVTEVYEMFSQKFDTLRFEDWGLN